MENLSTPLYALINNGYMKESHTKTAMLEDVDASTFIAFCEFGYTGQYVTPIGKDGKESKPLKVESKIEKEPEELPSDYDSWPHSQKRRYQKTLAYRQSREKEKEGEEDENEFFTDFWKAFISREFDGTLAKLSSEPDLLFHAKSYIFATKYLIEPLRRQSLATLHHDLCAYPFTAENSRLIVGLLGFVYSNTGRVEPGGESARRDVVIHYVACKLRILSDDEYFFTLLARMRRWGQIW